MVNSHRGRKTKGGILNSLNTLDQDQTEMSVDSNISNETEENMDLNHLIVTKNVIIFILICLLILSFLGINIFLWIGILIQFITTKIGHLSSVIFRWIGFYTGAVINTSADVVADTAKAGIDIAEGTVHSVGNLLQDRDNVSGPLPEQLEWEASVFETRPLEMEQQHPEMEEDNDYNEIKDELLNIGSDIESGAKEVLKTAETPIKMNIVENNAPTLDETINTSPPLSTEPTANAPTKTWCLVGDFDGRRSCTQVDHANMCMSGQTYQNQSDCLNIHAKSSPFYKGDEHPPAAKYMKTVDTIKTQNWGIPPPRPPPAAYAPPMVTNQIPLVQQPPIRYPCYPPKPNIPCNVVPKMHRI